MGWSDARAGIGEFEVALTAYSAQRPAVTLAASDVATQGFAGAEVANTGSCVAARIQVDCVVAGAPVACLRPQAFPAVALRTCAGRVVE